MPPEIRSFRGYLPDGRGSASIRVLHVDDDPTILDVTAARLEQIGDEFDVVTASDVPAGCDELEETPIDCVVCDYKLPSGNGIEFLQSVRETRPDLPFVLFTGKGGEGVASEAISAGVTDYIRKGGGADQFVLLANSIRQAVEQYRTDRALEVVQRRYERAARASSDAFVDWVIPEDTFSWSEGLGQPFGYTDDQTRYEFSWWKDRIHSEDTARVNDRLREALDRQEELVELEYRFRRADGTYAHTISRGYITYEGAEPVRITGALIDISDEKARQRSLAELHEMSRELIRAKTAREVCEIVVAATEETLELPAAALCLWSDDAGALQPQASTADAEEVFGELSAFTPGCGEVWDAFVDGATSVSDDGSEAARPDALARSAVVVPLGEFGVLLAGSDAADAVPKTDVRFAETLAANATAALRRAERERELREQERLLQEQNEELVQLDRVNSTIRTIQRDVVNATTRDEIVQAACDGLAQASRYQFVWVGSTDDAGQVTPEAWAGTDGGYLDDLLAERAGGSESLPAEQALDTGETVSVQHLRRDTGERPRLREAVDRGFQSLVSIPLTFHDTTYGVVEIYSKEATSFGPDEREILGEVCDFVANALNAIERRQALVLRSETELEFEIADADDVLFRLARASGCALALDSIVPQSGGEWVLYLGVPECERDSFRAVAAQQTSVKRVTELEGAQFEVAVSEFEIAKVLGEQGAKLQSLRATPDGGRVVIHLPQTTDVGSFEENCAPVFRTARLVSRSRVPESVSGESGVASPSGAPLTDRQRDVLEVAYRNGFFEWPRERTGEDIADRLAVSPPTFHRHVRLGTRALLEDVFE